MPNCRALLKAIDAYLAKADENLAEALDEAGFINTTELVEEIATLEDFVARVLVGETRYISRRLREAGKAENRNQRTETRMIESRLISDLWSLVSGLWFLVCRRRIGARSWAS